MLNICAFRLSFIFSCRIHKCIRRHRLNRLVLTMNHFQYYPPAPSPVCPIPSKESTNTDWYDLMRFRQDQQQPHHYHINNNMVPIISVTPHSPGTKFNNILGTILRLSRFDSVWSRQLKTFSRNIFCVHFQRIHWIICRTFGRVWFRWKTPHLRHIITTIIIITISIIWRQVS